MRIGILRISSDFINEDSLMDLVKEQFLELGRYYNDGLWSFDLIGVSDSFEDVDNELPRYEVLFEFNLEKTSIKSINRIKQ